MGIQFKLYLYEYMNAYGYVENEEPRAGVLIPVFFFLASIKYGRCSLSHANNKVKIRNDKLD